MPFRGEIHSLSKETHSRTFAKSFGPWPYHHLDEWKWFPHLVSFLFSFSWFCFPTLLHSVPHSVFRRIYLLLPATSPSIPGDRRGANFKTGVGSSNSHISTACCLPVSPDVDAGSYNYQMRDMPTAMCEA